MSLFDIITLAVVEGITEFLPISSTGHLILTSRLLGMAQTEFLKSFQISIQLGAILSVVVLYWRTLAADLRTMKKIVVAFIPAGVIGFIFYRVIKTFLLGNSSVVLWSLLLGGIFIIAFELFHRDKDGSVDEVSSISYAQAFLIGIFQSLAVVPGVSRSAATIIGGLALGLKRRTIVEFSFLLAVPTMAAAAAFDMAKAVRSFTPDQLRYLSVGFILSFAAALLAIKFFLSFIRNNSFIAFGIYRVVLALALWKC